MPDPLIPAAIHKNFLAAITGVSALSERSAVEQGGSIGCSLILASLTSAVRTRASEMGLPIYRNMGFRQQLTHLHLAPTDAS